MTNPTYTPEILQEILSDYEITQIVIAEFEHIRRTCVCNMTFFRQVQEFAIKCEFYELALICSNAYIFILRNYEQIMQHYKISQDMPQTELDRIINGINKTA